MQISLINGNDHSALLLHYCLLIKRKVYSIRYLSLKRNNEKKNLDYFIFYVNLCIQYWSSGANFSCCLVLFSMIIQSIDIQNMTIKKVSFLCAIPLPRLKLITIGQLYDNIFEIAQLLWLWTNNPT